MNFMKFYSIISKMNKFIILITILLITNVFGLYSGDATFYGDGGAGAQGACMLPVNFNNIQNTVAINPYQYENGQACGKCVIIYPSSNGIGMTPIASPIFATIDNLCPECKNGDIDIGLGGDGRWIVNWEFTPCQRNLRGSAK